MELATFVPLIPAQGPGASRALGMGLLAGLLLGPAPVARAQTPPAWGEQVASWDQADAERAPSLHLSRGSLIESIGFSAAYLRAAPGEDCVVLWRRRGTELVGAAVYTRRGALFARSPERGTFVLSGLSAEDINRPDRLRAALASGERGRPAAGPSPPEAESAQLEQARAAVSFFPSAVVEASLPLEGSDGRVSQQTRRLLSLYWCGRQILWSPGLGALAVPLPRDPSTGSPRLCLAYPELPESLRFAAEYPRAHPEERAALVINPEVLAHPGGVARAGVAVAAYSRRGEVLLHTVWGEIPLPGARPEDLARPDFAPGAFRAYTRRLRTLRPGESPAVPTRLVGDTPELQIRRAVFQLQTTEAREVPTRGQPRLILEWRSLQYGYEDNPRARGAAYLGWNPRYLPPLLDGILFAGDFHRRFPEEKVVVIAHPPAGRISYPPGKMNAHVFYTRGSELWGHIAEDHAGEYRVEGAAAGDIDRPERLLALCRSNPALDRHLKAATSRLLSPGGDYHRPWERIPPFDSADFSVDGLRGRLADLGVPCAAVPHRERSEDGQVVEYPDQSLLFRFGGMLFVYAREKVYRARSFGYSDHAL